MAIRISGERYVKFRALVRRDHATRGLACWICQMPIDYNLPHLDDMGYLVENSWELDHYYPRSTHPELQLDPGNARPSHARCNRHRSDTPPELVVAQQSLGQQSRRW